MMKNSVFLRDGLLWIASLQFLLLAAVSPPLQAQDYIPLEGLRVSDGRVQFGFASAGQCIKFCRTRALTESSTPLTPQNGRGEPVPLGWTSQEQNAQGLCAYSPTSPGEYRLVAEISIDGERGHYSSENTLTVEGEGDSRVRAGGHALLPRLRGWRRVVRATGGQQYRHYRSSSGRCDCLRSRRPADPGGSSILKPLLRFRPWEIES